MNKKESYYCNFPKGCPYLQSVPFPIRFLFLTETVSEDASGALTGHTTKIALKNQINCGIFHQSPLI